MGLKGEMTMVHVLQKYKVIAIILSLLILVGAVWAIYVGLNSKKIPMRGVFVLEQVKNAGESFPT